ncbi:metal ABC transporter solute-binding protein, Zn/Mn family [Vibrio splendidus]|uniref:metal ABC transporter solute-binding protein, Zn/Mn family n=1 Tax=Vibrio splendidus TaxID=29497 RepID=UPI000D36FFC8|nr:zinc ABC transporter substrate-binding protein [Vibrio splendidus]PTP40076.1 hypothetical protein CWN83_24495 [Vibrio splendidus]
MRIMTLLMSLLAVLMTPNALAKEYKIDSDKLTIGITLQPYYSYVKAVVGDKVNILPLVDAGFNPHNYLPQPNDLKRLSQMSQLQETIEKIRASGIDVLFYELNMPNRFVDTIEAETGVQLYRFSHMTHGEYQDDKVEVEMKKNLETLIEAMKFAAANQAKSGNA